MFEEADKELNVQGTYLMAQFVKGASLNKTGR